MTSTEEERRARACRLIENSLVWDNHTCMPLRPHDTTFLPQLERSRAAGIDVISINVGAGPLDLALHLRMLASLRRWFSDHRDRYVLVETASDVDRARQEDKVSIAFDVEGMTPLDEGDNGLIQLFYDLGVRWMLIAYNRKNAAGGGCLDDDDPGLSAHGRAMLAEMKRADYIDTCGALRSSCGRKVVSWGRSGIHVWLSLTSEFSIKRRARAQLSSSMLIIKNSTGGFCRDNHRYSRSIGDWNPVSPRVLDHGDETSVITHSAAHQATLHCRHHRYG